MAYSILKNGKELQIEAELVLKEKYAANSFGINLKAKEDIVIYKYAANLSSENHPKESLSKIVKNP